MAKKAVTIKDISKIMGVSVSTVTNALNGAPNVGGELRQAIIDKANELGYKPNFHARAMVKNGINIALISTRQPHQYIDMVMKGMKEEVERLSDYKINLKKYLYHDNMAAIEAYDCVKRMIADGADGVIFSASFTTDDYIDLLNDYVRKNNIPVIGTDEDVGLLPYICNINSDSKVIAQLVAQFIYIKYGEGAKVGVITTSHKHANHRKLIEVFKTECEKYKLELLDVLENNDDSVKTYECTHKLITEHPDINVIYKTSFDSVFVCRCIENMGYKGKISVIGHDIYQEMIPYLQNDMLLATVFQNPQKQGRSVVRILAQWILGERNIKKHIRLRPELVLKSNIESYLEEHDCVMP